MLDNKGFDEWAGDYDESILKCTGYPFEGYYELLGHVQNLVEVDPNTLVLDIGIGTGKLTYEIYKRGGLIHGLDFSPKMIELARLKMPNGEFFLFDFQNGLPSEVVRHNYDYIVSSYAIHHVEDDLKMNVILQMKSILKDGGVIVIADVSFRTQQDHDGCKLVSGDLWDSEEHYMVADTLVPQLEAVGLDVKYIQKSSCGGIMIIK
jgi:putative AdoMet-dependent methyltransferase